MSKIVRFIKTNYPIILVLLLALILRIYNITARDYWYDESFTAILVHRPWTGMWQGILNDVHPPVYYILLKAYTYIAGWSPFSLRFFSTVFSVSSIFLIYKIAGKLYNPYKSYKHYIPLTAAFLAAISPFQIQYAQEARQYSLMGFWILCSMYLITKTNNTKEQKRKVAYLLLSGVFIGLAFLTQYAAVLVIPPLLLFLLLYINKNSIRNPIKTLANIAVKIFIIMLPFAVAFIAWFPIFNKHRNNMGSPAWIPNPEIGRIFQSIYTYIFGEWPKQAGVSIPNENILGVGAALAGGVVITGLVTLLIMQLLTYKESFKYPKPASVLPLIFSLTILFESFLLAKFFNFNFYMERYLFPASFGLYLAAGSVLGYSYKEKKKTTAIFTITPLLIIATLMLTIQPKPVDNKFQKLAKQVPQGKYTSIVTKSPFDLPTIELYLHNKAKNFLVYNAAAPQEDVTGWVIIGNRQIYDLSKVDKSNTLILE